METTAKNAKLFAFGLLATVLIIGFAILKFNATASTTSAQETHSVTHSYAQTVSYEATAETSTITIPTDYEVPTSLEVPRSGKFEILSQGISDLSAIIDYAEQGITNDEYWSVSLTESIIRATNNFTCGGYVILNVLLPGNRPNFIKDMRKHGAISSEAIVIKAICYGCVPIRIDKGMSMTESIVRIKSFIH